jgi:hypothetical protein
MTTADDSLTLTEDQRLRARIHNLVDRVQEHGGQLHEHKALIEQLSRKNPDASQLRFTAGVVFTIVVSAVTVAGLLWKVSSGVDSLALRMDMNYTIMKERTDQLEKALNEETRQRQLQAFELKESLKRGKP